jgi:hypothetical protein
MFAVARQAAIPFPNAISWAFAVGKGIYEQEWMQSAVSSPKQRRL